MRKVIVQVTTTASQWFEVDVPQDLVGPALEAFVDARRSLWCHRESRGPDWDEAVVSEVMDAVDGEILWPS